jgi:NAD-dependent histone deacetylase SIR2
MVGAGISTSAGIPDFRSDNGLFKQLQEKYNLSGPEEFFYLDTFYKNPMFFYEFTKLFDLSKTKPTIAHKFMNFFIKKNYVKYIFTQNIDGLELKAKIPKEKLVFAHGNFLEGHCPKCKEDIDIEKINEGIDKGEVYFCPKCKGPCKPKIVFYGENLPLRFFECLQDIKDIDLVIIMGTSLKVYPFAGIPEFVEKNEGIIVFNMEKVGMYRYNEMAIDAYFIEGKIDENIIKFLKDVKLYDEFDEFIEDEYHENLNKIIGKEKKLISIKDNVEDLSKEMDGLKIDGNAICAKPKMKKNKIQKKEESESDDEKEEEDDLK